MTPPDQFDDRSSHTDMEKRNDSRLPVLWEGSVETENGDTYPCAVRDISQAGALITVAGDFEDEEDLLLTIPGLGEFAGRVKWRGTSDVGLLLIAGPDLELKRYAEASGADLSTTPVDVGHDPIAG